MAKLKTFIHGKNGCKVINTPMGEAKLLKDYIEHKRRKFLISCPLGRGNCIFGPMDVCSEGRYMCPYCRKCDPMESLRAAKEEGKREMIGRPKRGCVPHNCSWTTLRYEVLKRDGGKCVLCGRGAADGVKLNVDHIKPASLYPELYYDINNLQTLCEDCNKGKSDSDAIDWRTNHG